MLEVYGQVNLVPNFSFEEYSDCPMNDGQSYFANGWSKYSIESSTPDYYNSCSESSAFGVPKSFICNQNDNRGCNAYIGLGTIASSSFDREYIGIELSSTLIVGQKYFLSFYTAMGEYKINGIQYGMPSNNLGLLLSTVSFSETNPISTNNFAHLYSESIITDSVNWIRISGSLIADSSYKYVVLGNFFNDFNTDTTHYNCPNCMNQASYYLMDDICISTDSLLCNGGIELLSCNLSVEKNNLENQFDIFPNPVSDFLHINSQNKIENIEIYDFFGHLIYSQQNFPNEEYVLNIEKINSGIYFFKIRTEFAETIKKIVIN